MTELTSAQGETPSLETALRPAALEAYLQQRLERPDTLIVEGQAAGGQSNVTAFIRFGQDRWVLRRPPVGDLLPTAHDVSREYRFVSALADTPVPVPTPILLCEDPSVIGAPFYVMTRVEGNVLNSRPPAELDVPELRRGMCESLIDVLGVLHGVDWSSVGLQARPGDYLERQFRRWTGQIELTETIDRLPRLDEITQWLLANRPPHSDQTIIHNDYQAPNVMFGHPPNIAITAVLDWELATVGDPLADLFYVVREWGIPNTETATGWLTAREGAPPRAEMLDRYQTATSREVRHAQFYLVFGQWRNIIIHEGLYAAYVRGESATAANRQHELGVPALVEETLELMSALPSDLEQYR